MSKKKYIKGFISGFIISAVLFSSLTVFGAPLKKKIEVIFNNFRVYSDERLVSLKDTKGNLVQTFTYNGSVYLPIEAAAKVLEKSVEWDDKTNSLYIGKRNDVGTPSVWLTDIDYSSKDYNWSEQLWNPDKNKDNTGKTYKNGIIVSGSGAMKEYLIDSRYKRFKGTCVIRYEDRDNNYTNMYLYIFDGDKPIYSTNLIRADYPAVEFDIDVSGVKRLKLKIVGNGCFCIVNSGFFE